MGEEVAEHHHHQQQETPLLQSNDSSPTHLKRTGTQWTATAHIITGVIGSGVLSLAWSMAQLGWIAGPLAMVLFALVTLISVFLLSNCYRYPHPEFGPARNRSYLEAVRTNLGETRAMVCGFVVNISLYGIGIAYTITAATSMRAIQKANCYHDHGHNAACEFGDAYYMLIFGVAQIAVCLIPDFHNMEWLSTAAAIMSFAYAIVSFALGLAKVVGNGVIKGSIYGISTSSSVDKFWLISQALGDIAFAYPFSLILIDIQDTLKSPPAANETMKKASTISIFITTFFYLCCAGFGYAAFGDSTPGNLLTGFGFYEPYWLIDFANACIVLHLVGGYQVGNGKNCSFLLHILLLSGLHSAKVYTQPLFATIEKWFGGVFPDSRFVNQEFTLKLPLLPALRLNLFRLCFRTIYVASTTLIATIFPYFNQVLGVIGAINFWPLSIYFPVEMYFSQKKIRSWTTRWVVLRIFSIVCLIVTVYALAGSIRGLITAKLS